ncbi:Glycosyltransferase [Minicystis rosea]|nr:Glycosyltransferase [Minicystis rosea]
MNAGAKHDNKRRRMLRTVFSRPSDEASTADYYSPVLAGPETLLRAASGAGVVRDVLGVLAKLEPDDYTRYLTDYYGAGLSRFGEGWHYADICTVLHAAARLAEPKTYLEIGVRRGRSMAMVAEIAKDARLVGFDMWMENYAGMPNPGADFVRSEIARVGHRGSIELISGDSHVTVPRFLEENPDLTFDIITVDGDHSHDGALADLRTVIPRLSLGGILVFDDIVHPLHPYLVDVWRSAVAEDGGLSAGEYAELGYGVAFAVRTRPSRERAPFAKEAARAVRSRLRAVGQAIGRIPRPSR